MSMWGSIANEHFRMTSIRVSMMHLGAADVRSVDLTWLDGAWGGLLWLGLSCASQVMACN